MFLISSAKPGRILPFFIGARESRMFQKVVWELAMVCFVVAGVMTFIWARGAQSTPQEAAAAVVLVIALLPYCCITRAISELRR